MIEEAKTRIYMKTSIAPISRLLLSLNSVARLCDSKPALHGVRAVRSTISAREFVSDEVPSTEFIVRLSRWRMMGLDIAIGVSIGLALFLLGLVTL